MTFTCVYAVHEGQDLDPDSLPPMPLEPPGRGVQSEAVHTRKPVIIPDLAERLRQIDKVYVGSKKPSPDYTTSAICVPMITQGRMLGVMQIQSLQLNRFTSQDANLLTLICNTAAVAVQNAHLIHDLRRVNDQLMQSYDAIVHGWVMALDLRDHETEGHSERVAALTVQVARRYSLSRRSYRVCRSAEIDPILPILLRILSTRSCT